MMGRVEPHLFNRPTKGLGRVFALIGFEREDLHHYSIGLFL